MTRRIAFAILITALVVSTAGAASPSVPLIDLGSRMYLGQFQGGLYPGGANVVPADQARLAVTAAKMLTRRGTDGAPNATGKIVMLSIGMSNTSQEFCSGAQPGAIPCSASWWGAFQSLLDPTQVCKPWTFAGQAWADPAVEKNILELVDGAQSGMTALEWSGTPRPKLGDPWPVVSNRLATVGLSEKQVQVVWLKMAQPDPTVSLPATGADAYTLLMRLGTIVRTAKTRYPNLQLVFVSSRVYGGYATTPTNPEPYAHEEGFSFKWLIQAQITQMRGGPTDPLAGSLDYRAGIAPVLIWGPYLWANGMMARSDGLFWAPSDFEPDGTHPGPTGEYKVGLLLLDYFKTAPAARCWFVAGQRC